MKKILMSIFAIAAVAAVAGVGSYALWSDTERAENNYIQASYMDAVLASTPIEINNVVPGQTGTATLTITNDSPNVNGVLSVTATSLVDYENWCVEPEKIEGADPTCSLISDTTNLPDGSPTKPFVGAGRGELSQHVKVQFQINGNDVGQSVTLAQLASMPTPITLPGVIPAGQSVTITANWEVDNSTTPFEDNIFMTDAVVGNFEVTMSQSTN